MLKNKLKIECKMTELKRKVSTFQHNFWTLLLKLSYVELVVAEQIKDDG